MKTTIDILEKEIDILLEKISDINLSKYDKYDLCQNYIELENISDEIFDSLNGKKSERYDNCIEKMRKLNGHFYHSQYAIEYSEIFNKILEEENDDDSDIWTKPNKRIPVMFPNSEEGEDPFDSYDLDD